MTRSERVAETINREMPDARELLRLHNAAWTALPLKGMPRRERARISVVTDSINTGSLYGGVGTAFILAVLLARRLDTSLRIVTRREAAEPANFTTVLQTHGIPWKQPTEFAFAPIPATEALETLPDEIFLTTSWWSTASLLPTAGADRILYLLQEDERLFYPAGDQHLRASETLAAPGLRCMVNSRALLEHLAGSGLPQIATRGIAFEPAFPWAAYHPEYWGEGERERPRFLFYARPNNLRNLYWRGLEAICAALEAGILDASRWEIRFVGRDLDPIRLPGGVTPIIGQNLPWPEYAAWVRQTDLGLALMYTPHSSYPPLDLAAGGAAVVTNRFSGKTDLTRLAPNIIMADPGIDVLLEGLRQGAALALDRPRRQRNYDAGALPRDWASTLAPVLDWAAALDLVAA